MDKASVLRAAVIVAFCWRLIIVLGICCTVHSALAQSLTLLYETRINTPVAVSCDRYDNLYIGDRKGNIQKFDSFGKHLQEYSPQHIGAITAIEAWPSVQIFVFSENLQSFSLLNRMLTPIQGSPYRINSTLIPFARVATLASDGHVWIFDDTDFSLKKYSPQQQQIINHSPLSLIVSSQNYQINFIREYQNMVYVNDYKSGILVFDNMGNYKKLIPFPELSQFSFRTNDLCFIQNSQLHFYDLYTTQKRSLDLPAHTTFNFALPLTNGKIALINNAKVQIYQLNE